MGGQQLWQVLSGLPAWRVTEVPRPDVDSAAAGDWGAEERVAALVSAYGCDAPIAVGWVRDRPGGPVRVLSIGPALAGCWEWDDRNMPVRRRALRGPLPRRRGFGG